MGEVRLLTSAAIYFGLVFGAGFVLGPVRVFWLEPQVGLRTAELIESPFMLAVIVVAGRWVGRGWLGERSATTRMGVGLLAAVGVLAADLAVGVGLRGQSVVQVFADRDPVSGAVYYVLVGLFAVMPWLVGGAPDWAPTSRPNHPLKQTPAACVILDPKLRARRGLLSGVVRLFWNRCGHTPMIEIRDHFRKIADLLKAKAAVAGGTGHSCTTGRLRELIIQEFLRPHLPRTFDILAGVVLDSTGGRSSQEDCLIVDARFPLIDVGSESEALFLAESVVATMEIKSYLDKGQLLDSLAKAARIKSLKRKGRLEYSKGGVTLQVANPDQVPILAYIFAYDGAELDTIRGHVADFSLGKVDGTVHDHTQIVDGICVLTKGVCLTDPVMATVSGSSVMLPNRTAPQMRTFAYKCDGLFGFYRRLHSDLTYLRLANWDLDVYYAASELE